MPYEAGLLHAALGAAGAGRAHLVRAMVIFARLGAIYDARRVADLARSRTRPEGRRYAPDARYRGAGRQARPQ